MPKLRDKREGAAGRPKIIDRLLEKLDRAEGDLRPYHAKWIEVRAFRMAEQYVEVDPNSLEIVERPKKDENSIRLVENVLGSSMRIAAAKLTHVRMEPECRPDRKDPDAIEIANLQEHALVAISEALGLYEGVFKVCVTDWLESGRMITKTVWAEFGGDATGEDDAAKKPPELRQGDAGSASVAGDLQALGGFPFVYRVDPLRFVAPYWATRQNLPWCIEVMTFAADELADRYGADAPKGAKSPDVLPLAVGSLPGQVAAAGEGMVLVYEYWEMPSRRHKYGKRVLFTDARVLETGGTRDRPILELPYTVLADPTTSESLLCGHGIGWDAVGLQKAVNNSLSQQVDVVNENLSRPYYLTQGAKYPRETVEGHRIIELPPGASVPTRGEEMKYPAEGFQLYGLLKASVTDVFGVHEVSAGESGGARSGRMVQYLAELDQMKFGPSAEALRELHVGTWKLILKILRDHLTAPLLLRVVSWGRQWEVRAFYANRQTSFSVTVKASPEYMQGKAAFEQKTLQMFQFGLLDKDEAKAALRFSASSAKADLMEAYQEREIEWVIQDVTSGREQLRIPMPMALEDHQISIDRCMVFLTSSRLDQVPEEFRATVRDIIYEHLMAHYAMLIQLQADPLSVAMRGAASGQPTQTGQGGTDDLANGSAQGVPPGMFGPDAGGEHTEEVLSRIPPGGHYPMQPGAAT